MFKHLKSIFKINVRICNPSLLFLFINKIFRLGFRFSTWPFLCSAPASRGELGRSIEPGRQMVFSCLAQFSICQHFFQQNFTPYIFATSILTIFPIIRMNNRASPELRRRPEGGEGGLFGFVRDPPSTAL